MQFPENYRRLIADALPEVSLGTAEFIQEGFVNDVVFVEGLVFRFPKNDWARDRLLHEAEVIERLRPRTTLRLPNFQVLTKDMAVYQFLPGRPLTRQALERMEAARQVQIIQDLGQFLLAMHTAPTDGLLPSDTNRPREKWLGLLDRLREHLYPRLVRYQCDEIEAQFAPIAFGTLDMTYTPALVNGDLSPYHVLCDESVAEGPAIIDFGTAGVGDPAADLAVLLYNYREPALKPLFDVYPDIREALERARFWSGTLQLQWALAGVTGGHSWLPFAHLP